MSEMTFLQNRSTPTQILVHFETILSCIKISKRILFTLRKIQANFLAS